MEDTTSPAALTYEDLSEGTRYVFTGKGTDDGGETQRFEQRIALLVDRDFGPYTVVVDIDGQWWEVELADLRTFEQDAAESHAALMAEEREAKRAHQRNLADAHADGMHDRLPREGCPECPMQRRRS